MKYYRVTGSVGYRETCSCPNCSGHEYETPIKAIVAAENETHAISTVLMPMGDYATSNVVAYVASLRQIEALALADWNAGKPTASPLALAHARGEL